VSSWVSDLLASVPTHVEALADGETNPAALAALAHQRLRATPEQLCDCARRVHGAQARVPTAPEMTLEHLQILEQQIGQLIRAGTLLHPHQDAVERLAEVPGSQWIPRSRSLPKSALRSDVSLREMPLFVGRCLPRRRRERRRELRHRSPKGNVTCGACSIRLLTPPVKARKHLRDHLSPLCPRLGIIKPSGSSRIDSVV